MESVLDLFNAFGPGVLVPLACFGFVGIIAQWSLYDKCGLPGIDCIVPVKNVITFLKIMGRPASHSLMVMIPPPFIAASFLFLEGSALQFGVAAIFFIPWAYFMTKVYIELCQCFGHYKITDYIMVVLLNGFYVLHLGLSIGEKYRGPVYKKKTEASKATLLKGQLA